MASTGVIPSGCINSVVCCCVLVGLYVMIKDDSSGETKRKSGSPLWIVMILCCFSLLCLKECNGTVKEIDGRS